MVELLYFSVRFSLVFTWFLHRSSTPHLRSASVQQRIHYLFIWKVKTFCQLKCEEKKLFLKKGFCWKCLVPVRWKGTGSVSFLVRDPVLDPWIGTLSDPDNTHAHYASSCFTGRFNYLFYICQCYYFLFKFFSICFACYFLNLLLVDGRIRSQIRISANNYGSGSRP